jgi:hypothetical protein
MYNDPFRSATSETARNNWKHSANAVSVSMRTTRFLTFKLKVPEIPVCDIIPFYIEKAWTVLLGESGTLLACRMERS